MKHEQYINRILGVISASMDCPREKILSNSKKPLCVDTRTAFIMTLFRVFPNSHIVELVNFALRGCKDRTVYYWYKNNHERMYTPAMEFDKRAIVYRDMIDDLTLTFPEYPLEKYEDVLPLEDKEFQEVGVSIIKFTCSIIQISDESLLFRDRQYHFARNAIIIHLKKLFPRLILQELGDFMKLDHTSIIHTYHLHEEMVLSKCKKTFGFVRYFELLEELKQASI